MGLIFRNLDKAMSTDRDQVLARWMRDHWDRLVVAAETYRGRAVTGEDIALEAILVALDKRGRIEDPRVTGRWLEGFVRNVGRKAVTKRMRRQLLMRRHYRLLVSGNIESPETLLERKIADEKLEEAISTLPEHQQIVVHLKLDGLSYREIGEKLGKPVGTVKSDRSRAVRALRDTLAQGMTRS